jgi:hypothetical protein
MESLKEGVKFVFNNKTILGALSLDMIAVFWWSCAYCQFCTGYFESRPTGIWCFESRRLLALLMLIISAYFFLKKCWNEIIGSHFV